MRVLWFEVTVPKNFQPHSFHGAGWQDSLEQILKSDKEIELGIAFESSNPSSKPCKIDGVQYFPLNPSYSPFEKRRSKTTVDISRDKLISHSLKVIEDFKPDIIHVFGSEWCFGQVAEHTAVPVVIHMQGSIPPYNNALYPPGYSKWDEWFFALTHGHFRNLLRLPRSWKKQASWQKQEERTLRLVSNYMGRTEWDKRIVHLFHPSANYFYCSEALRPSFTESKKFWSIPGNKKLVITTTGCSSLWKGLDTVVRTAKLLKERQIDFEWNLIGAINHKAFVEWKEGVRMNDVGITLRGMLNAEDLLDILLRSDIYAHTAYIDNSPNSLCEAQYLGLPVIATAVGGIPSLVNHGESGYLVPANDPYQFAHYIIELANNPDIAVQMGKNARTVALSRHNPQAIQKDLLGIYNSLTNRTRIT